MNFFTDNILLILLLPVWAAFIIFSSAAFKITDNKKTTALITCLSTVISLCFALSLFKNSTGNVVFENSFFKFESLQTLFCLGTKIDKISTVFLLILMTISLPTQMTLYGNLRDKKHFNVCFVLVNLLLASTAAMFLSVGILQFFIFTAISSFITFLLLNFSSKSDEQTQQNSICLYTALTETIANTSLFFGILFLINTFNPNDFASQLLYTFDYTAFFTTEDYSQNSLLIADIFFAIFIFIKTAQFPFNFIRTKSNSTILGLIQSCGASAAGVFLMLRLEPLMSEVLENTIIILASFSALICAIIAASQNDLKKVLSNSSSMQYAIMIILACINKQDCAIIVFIIHAFSKALAFNAAGLIEDTCSTTNLDNIVQMPKNRNKSLFWLLISIISLSGLFFGGMVSRCFLLNELKTFDKTTLVITILAFFISSFAFFRYYFAIKQKPTADFMANNHKITNFSCIILALFVIIPEFIIHIKNFNLFFFTTSLVIILSIVSAYYSVKSNSNLYKNICDFSSHTALWLYKKIKIKSLKNEDFPQKRIFYNFKEKTNIIKVMKKLTSIKRKTNKNVIISIAFLIIIIAFLITAMRG